MAAVGRGMSGSVGPAADGPSRDRHRAASARDRLPALVQLRDRPLAGSWRSVDRALASGSPRQPGPTARPRPRAARPRRLRSRARAGLLAPPAARAGFGRPACLGASASAGLGPGAAAGSGAGFWASLLDARAGTRASRRRSCAASWSSSAIVRRADRVEQRPVVGDEQQRPGERRQRGLERLAALQVEVVGRLVEDQHVRARLDQDRQRQPARSPPDSPSSGFSASSPENRKRPSSARALPGVSPVACCAASTTGAAAVHRGRVELVAHAGTGSRA